MIDKGYIYYEDNKRIFINTSLGCTGKCSYCYLPKIGYSNKEIISKSKKCNEILEMIKENKIDINKETIITIGCFSECFDNFNKEETINIIKYFLEKGNQVQVSTKKKLYERDIEKIEKSIKYYGQFILFVSSATISKHEKIEENTDLPKERFENFKYISKFPVILYMKPILKNITYSDIELYKKVIEYYKIEKIVVGSIFTEEKSEETVHFSKENKLFYNEIEDEEKIIKELEKKVEVYRRSTEVVKEYKKQFNNIKIARKEVSKILGNDKSGHAMDHIERVYNLALKFAKSEKEKTNKEVIGLIALLHDVDDYKQVGKENSEKLINSREIIDKIDVDEKTKEQILEELVRIGYSKSLKGIRPKTIEGKIVSDADMCDASGSSGIIRIHQYCINKDIPFFDIDSFPMEDINEEKYTRVKTKSGVCHMFEKILKLEKCMMTEEGRKEAKYREQIIIDFLYHLFEEVNSDKWKRYLDEYLEKRK